MKWTRREFVALTGVLGLSGCARVKQSRLGQLTPDFEFGKDQPPRFAILSDIQLLDSRSVGILGRAVNAINNDPAIDFVVILGNITTHGTLQELRLAEQALARLNVPYYCVPGPNDRADDGEDGYSAYRRIFKKPQWRANMGGWTFIGLDSQGGGEKPATLGEGTLEWLDGQLSHLDAKRPIVLFCHFDLHPDGNGVRLENAADVVARFEGYTLPLVASGSYRSNQVDVHGQTTFVSTVACSSTQKNDDGSTEKGFRVYTLLDGQIENTFIDVPV